jgi:hypothetical protein
MLTRPSLPRGAPAAPLLRSARAWSIRPRRVGDASRRRERWAAADVVEDGDGELECWLEIVDVGLDVQLQMP